MQQLELPVKGNAYTSRRVVVEKLKPQVMYRETPDHDLDTGWRFLAGDESPQYLQTPGNVVFCDVQDIAALEPEVVPFLHMLPPVVFVNTGGSFEAAADPSLLPTIAPHIRLLCTQLALNPGTWKRLLELGVTPETALRLDFTFRAPDEQQARALAEELSTEGGEAKARRGGLLRRHVWVVEGRTSPTTWTLEKLNDWVHLMVLLGHRHNCAFDGWSTTVDRA
ncbi:MAG: DUF2185 domain-containing protein [Armatimonadetes bacterium]|nr:DUF2185 domain-containing protein [Armatimonadota bacterium]